MNIEELGSFIDIPHVVIQFGITYCQLFNIIFILCHIGEQYESYDPFIDWVAIQVMATLHYMHVFMYETEH